MMTAILVTGSIVFCLLVRVAITDICARTISNRDLAILLAAYCLLILFTGKVPNIVLAVTVFSV
ncbi:hypothetical protein JZM24_17510 [Candidatus Sodalis endolongispinus]|uniref:Uncharacterized protein n=1 Tax=Candidatus Sodalis endolongispinus TaxID=2812662 RepID=A0ABS5YGG9_9GAMM|nr:hypothetical protein [Candidatus Sodalis endolongispinus]MBT9433440.1 hypothetical protein [Candidatus Sodalis endolongispinus]